jgi:hypothetical protein
MILNITKTLSILLLIVFLGGQSLFSQNEFIEKRKMHNEKIDDPYIPRNKKDIETSPPYRSRGSGIMTIQVNTDEDGDNILWDAANEPSIAVDPNDHNRMVIGWRQFDDVSNNFRQAGWAYTEDGGETWTSPDPIDMGIFRSDPVIEVDNDGIFYYNSLTVDIQNNYWCDVFRTEPDIIEWGEGVFAQGGDKQWMAIDNTGGMGDGNIYAFWNSTFSICPPGSYTRSIDGGETYEDCDGVPGDPIWGTNTVGPDGELYLIGDASNTSFVVTKSTTAQDTLGLTSWDYYTYIDLGGELTGWQPVNPSGLVGQAWIDCDRSDGPGRGYVYVLGSLKMDNGDPADVMFARSIDGGLTWEDPVRINDDLFNDDWQWFGSMSVAPNGRIDVTWLDTRNHPGTNIFMSELYYSYSIDNGVTWSENERLSEQFNPHLGWPNQNKMGDYFDMVSFNDGVHLAWANTINGEQDVYYSFIDPWYVGVDDRFEENILDLISYPNPASNKTTLRYNLPKTSEVKIEMIDLLGNITTLRNNELQQFGTHNEIIDVSNYKSGVYFCKVTTQKGSQTIKITVI